MTTTDIQRKPMPVTILSGFLGSGKTTLLENILRNISGLRVAVIVNDMAELNIDAKLVKDHKVAQKEEKLIELQNGCICCTLRGDLLDELLNLYANGKFDYIVIESSGISEPMQVAETFSSDFSQNLLDTPDDITNDERTLLTKLQALGGVEQVAKIDTTVTVVDAINFFDNVETIDFLANRWGDNGQGESDRTVTDLMFDQIEFSDVIILNKVSEVRQKKTASIEAILKQLNPVAKIIKTDYCNVDLKEVINTGLYDFEKASSSAGWLKSINERNKEDSSASRLSAKPETEEYNVNSFVYTSRKPFHPERLYKTLQDKFFIIEQTPSVEMYETENEDSDDDDRESAQEDNTNDSDNSENMRGDEKENEQDDDDELTAKELLSNRKKSPLGPLLRSKGFFWLATRNVQRGEWSSAGQMLTFKGGIPWFDVSGFDDIPSEVLPLIKKDFQEPHGDRRNEIVFIGTGIDKRKIEKYLDECLLNDDEYKQFVDITNNEPNLIRTDEKLSQVFLDGFEDWGFPYDV